MVSRRRMCVTSANKTRAPWTSDRAEEFVDAPAFDDVAVIEQSASRDERDGEPLRVCLACGEEEPSAGPCAHREVAVFAAATAAAFEAAARVRRAMDELSRARRSLATIAHAAVGAGEAVLDEAPEASRDDPSATSECAACAARAALDEEASPSKPRKPRASRAKKAQRESIGEPESAQRSFSFARE